MWIYGWDYCEVSWIRLAGSDLLLNIFRPYFTLHCFRITRRLLTLLSMNAMPMGMAQLIYNHTNDKKYFRATVTLKHGASKCVSLIILFLIRLLISRPGEPVKLRHCIQSTEKNVLVSVCIELSCSFRHILCDFLLHLDLFV